MKDDIEHQEEALKLLKENLAIKKIMMKQKVYFQALNPREHVSIHAYLPQFIGNIRRRKF